jgi:hypothetical protein
MAVGAHQADDADAAGRGLEDGRRRQADIDVGAQQREGEPARGFEQRVDAVVELVVAGRGRGDRQVRDVAPRSFAQQRVGGIADHEVADVEPQRGLALALAVEQLDDAGQRPARPIARGEGTALAPRSVVARIRASVPFRGGGRIVTRGPACAAGDRRT